MLDVGSGTGILTLAMAVMAEKGRVYGVEHVKELVEGSLRNIEECCKGEGIVGVKERIRVKLGDGRKGWC